MHNTIASSVYNSIASKSSKFYFFLGKTVPYSEDGGVDQVETPLPTYKYELSTRRDIISMKEVAPSDISFVIPRRNWEIDTTYDFYDDSYSPTNLSNSGADSINTASFYALTSEYNLYICLDNNLNARSTVRPTGTDYLPFVASDGYKWKFVMSIPLALQTKFMTAFYIPVTNAINSIFYNNGAIDEIVINNPGSGYSPNTTASITIANGTTATGSFVVGRNYIIAALGTTTTNDRWNTIAGTSGVNYIVGSSITPAIVGTGLGDGTVKGVGAVLKPRISTVNGEISTVDIISGGTGYGATTTLAMVGIGTGQFIGNASAVLTPVVVGGIITHIIINDPGLNYGANSTTLTVQSATGTGAHLSAIVESGQITGVIIDSPGQGYNAATVTAFGNLITDSQAQITVSTSGGTINTAQANIELLAVSGSIDHIHIDDGGKGYSAVNITITGDGEGALATCDVIQGSLHKMTITNRGQGYTYANVNVTSLESLPITPATVRAIIPPFQGHGKNALKEFFTNTLMFYNAVANSGSNEFDINNDYRQFGLIKNPTAFNSPLAYRSALGSACVVATGTVANGFPLNDAAMIDSLGNIYLVIATTVISGTNIKLLLQPINNTIPSVGSVLLNANIAFSVSAVATPTIDKYSGDMLYIDNRAAFYQTDDQTVVLQTVLKF